MAEQDAAPAAEPAAPTEPAKPAPAADTVPYDRFREVNESAKTLKAELDEMRKQIRERDEAEMSAAEREKAARERAEGELNAAKAEAESFKRSRLIARAAREAGFSDPDFAAEHLTSRADIETEAQAAKAVDQLAKRVPGLLKQEKAPPEIGQVLKDGEPVKGDEAAVEAGIRQLDKQLSEALGFTG